MGKDKKEKKVNDIQETDCYQEGDTTETIPDEDTGCTNESQELTELEAELQKVREERDLYLSMAQRLQAEFDNFRKRNEAEASKAYQNTVYDTVERFLPVLDNLQRGLEVSVDSESTQSQAIYKGMEMVTKQFRYTGKVGYRGDRGSRSAFDPTYHDAVMQVEAENEDQKQSGRSPLKRI